jgi:hypothetical protein
MMPIPQAAVHFQVVSGFLTGSGLHTRRSHPQTAPLQTPKSESIVAPRARSDSTSNPAAIPLVPTGGESHGCAASKPRGAHGQRSASPPAARRCRTRRDGSVVW